MGTMFSVHRIQKLQKAANKFKWKLEHKKYFYDY